MTVINLALFLENRMNETPLSVLIVMRSQSSACIYQNEKPAEKKKRKHIKPNDVACFIPSTHTMCNTRPLNRSNFESRYIFFFSHRILWTHISMGNFNYIFVVNWLDDRQFWSFVHFHAFGGRCKPLNVIEWVLSELNDFDKVDLYFFRWKFKQRVDPRCIRWEQIIWFTSDSCLES